MDTLKFQLVVGALVRWAATLLAGYLVSKGALTSESEAEFGAAVVAILVPLLWSLYQKNRHVDMVDKALDLPSHATRADLKN